MNRLIPLSVLALILGNSVPAQAKNARFYIGTYTKDSNSKGIYMSGLDTQTGKLSPVTVAGEAQDPSFLALTVDGFYLYAAVSGSSGGVAAYQVKPDGALEFLNKKPAGGAGTCHLSVDISASNVLAANYDSGTVSCLRTNPDGSLANESGLVAFVGSGPNPERQKKPFAHSVYIDPTNSFAYACDLGTDNVWIMKFDPMKGTLKLNDQPCSGAVPPGSGPRHLAMTSDGTYVYVCNEMGHSVTAFNRDIDSGGLTAVQTIPTLPEGAKADSFTTAEVVCHPSGKWVYVTNRDVSKGGKDSFAVFSVGDGGALTLVETVPAHVQIPRSFDIDPTGHWVVVAGQGDNRLAVFSIDQKTGKLTATEETLEVPSPVCVLFAPLGRDK